MKDNNLWFCKSHNEHHTLDIRQAEISLYNNHLHKKERILLRTLLVVCLMILWNVRNSHSDMFDISWGFHMSYMYADNVCIPQVTYHQLS